MSRVNQRPGNVPNDSGCSTFYVFLLVASTGQTDGQTDGQPGKARSVANQNGRYAQRYDRMQ